MEEAAKDLVDCEEHGRQPAALACLHVATESGRGFYTAQAEGVARPQAWCAACDACLRREGGWTDEAFKQASISLICALCWDQARARNADGNPLRRIWRSLRGR
jgi:hypothetical protein